MGYRIIKYHEFDAFMNMAIDEAISEGVRNGNCQATIRLYGWKPSAVSIGYFQGLKNEVDLEECKKLGVDVVRRRTGGGAVYHDNLGEVTYSIIAPEDHFKRNIVDSYRQICATIIEALRDIGIESVFSPINDITSGGKKISGNAQTRRGGVLLQHGTILFTVDVEKMFSVLSVSQEKVSDKLIQSVKKRVTSVTEITDEVTKDELIEALEKAFIDKYDCDFSEYTDDEIKRAEELAKERYSTEEWNSMR